MIRRVGFSMNESRLRLDSNLVFVTVATYPMNQPPLNSSEERLEFPSTKEIAWKSAIAELLAFISNFR
jgi:hypothetical protein